MYVTTKTIRRHLIQCLMTLYAIWNCSLATCIICASDTFRVVWQDREKKTLLWADFQLGQEKKSTLQGQRIEGFPELPAHEIELVQMEMIKDVLVVGVRDFFGGEKQSGWVAIDFNTTTLAHSSDAEESRIEPPKVVESIIDDKQGNPAHLYVYDDEFYIANDRLSGFTRIAPNYFDIEGEQMKESQLKQFYRGGMGHITLAAFDKKLAFATRIAGTKDGKGLVDVVDLQKPGENSVLKTIELPYAGLHGAICNGEKVFFASKDGIQWVSANDSFTKPDESNPIHHISLGQNSISGRPNRTGAFSSFANWVLFVSGSGEESYLGMIDSKKNSPILSKLMLSSSEGNSLVTPEILVTSDQRVLGFVFEDAKAEAFEQNKSTSPASSDTRASDGQLKEYVHIVDLDPNKDGDFADAIHLRKEEVGRSKVDGHYGHHAIAGIAGTNYAVITNPGDGTMQVLDLQSLKLVANLQVQGMPTKLLARLLPGL